MHKFWLITVFTLIFLSLPALAYETPDIYICTVDQCEENSCTVETPEGFVTVFKKKGYYEGKKLTAKECPVEVIEPT